MEVEQFWKLIEKTHQNSQGAPRKQADLLVDELAKLSEADILSYQSILEDMVDKAYIGELWDVAFILASGWGCSDDGFEYFRAWLVGQGKDVYEKALSDPESLVDVVNFGQETQWEELLGVAMYAYEMSTHKDMATMPNTRHGKPRPELKGTFTKSDEERLARFPKATAKFWKERLDEYESGQHNELENRMRPGAYSVKGFLGSNESLEQVLLQDQFTLRNIPLTYESLVKGIEQIIGTALKQKHELLGNLQELQERENTSIAWPESSTLPLFSIDSLPSIKVGFLVDDKFQVFFHQWRGFQNCPWNCKQPEWGSFDFLLLNRQTGEYMIAPGLIVHLIREHHFFEGQESPYRVDPFKLVQVLELVS